MSHNPYQQSTLQQPPTSPSNKITKACSHSPTHSTPMPKRPQKVRRHTSEKSSSKRNLGGSFRRASSARRYTLTAAAAAAASESASAHWNSHGSSQRSWNFDLEDCDRGASVEVNVGQPVDDSEVDCIPEDSIDRPRPFDTIILDQTGEPVDKKDGEGSDFEDDDENDLAGEERGKNVRSSDSRCVDEDEEHRNYRGRSMVQAACYRGLEVVFATGTDDFGKPCILVIASRTRMALQTLVLPTHQEQEKHHEHPGNDCGENNEQEQTNIIVGLHCNVTTGLLCVIMSHKRVYTFYPVPTAPSKEVANVKEQEVTTPVTLFARYVWTQGRIIYCHHIFRMSKTFEPSNRTTNPVTSKNTNSTINLSANEDAAFITPLLPHISSSVDWKVLISHADQLAVYDVSPLPLIPKDDALLIWRTELCATVTHSALSGDGRAIAFVLEGEGVGVPYAFGVRTLLRDKGNGGGRSFPNGGSVAIGLSSDVVAADEAKRKAKAVGMGISDGKGVNDGVKRRTGGIAPPPIPTQEKYSQHCITMESYGHNMDILYKPGPFLVHSSTVTRLSFRGGGSNHSSVSEFDHKPTTASKKRPPTSSAPSSDDPFGTGNDLLLTSCRTDGSMRVFSQGTWKLLLHWETPPDSRADWIQGITMCNLGDLDPYPKASKLSSSSSTASLNKSYQNKSSYTVNPNSSFGDLNEGNNKIPLSQFSTSNSTGTKSNSSTTHNNLPSGWQSQPIPNCAAGAWISELTFRGTFPALRLSRLSFLQSGGDAWAPAHFESVASILPPATLIPGGVLGKYCGVEGTGLVVQGIWPAWDPWEVHPDHKGGGAAVTSGGSTTADGGLMVGGAGRAEGNNTGRSAMSLIGAIPRKKIGVAGVGPNVGIGDREGCNLEGSSYHGGDTTILPGSMHAMALGGTHSPPAELRLVASHAIGDKIVLMEFPLWGDTDVGVIELGSPLRYCLQLKDWVPLDVRCGPSGNASTLALTNGERQADKGKTGTCEREQKKHSIAPLPSTTSTRCAYLEFESNGLCGVVSEDRKRIELSWRKKGTANIIEDHNNTNNFTRSPSLDSVATTVSLNSMDSYMSFETDDDDVSNDKNKTIPRFSDWSIIPMPISLPSLLLPRRVTKSEKISLIKWWPDENFGGPPRLFALTTLGTLILYEMPPPWSAIEPLVPMGDPPGGSVTTDSFPAADTVESGMEESAGASRSFHVATEDDDEEEYAVNITPHPDFGLGLRMEAHEGGMAAVAGSFKKHPLTGGRLPAEKAGKISLGDQLVSVNDVSLEGKTFDEIISTVRFIGAKGKSLCMKFRKMERNIPKLHEYGNDVNVDEGMEVVKRSKKMDLQDENSVAATLRLDSESENQQEFGRIVAIIRNVLPSYSEEKSPRSLVLLPWYYGEGAPIPYTDRGATLLVTAVGRTITVFTLETFRKAIKVEDSARLTPLGSVELDEEDDEGDIKSLEVIKRASEGWCVAACERSGTVTLVLIDIAVDDNSGNQNNVAGVEATQSVKFNAVFRTHKIFRCDHKSSDVNEFLVRAPSINILGTMPVGQNDCSAVNVWSLMPRICTTEKNQNSEVKPVEYYEMTEITHHGNTTGHREPILDFRWVASGSIDAFPWLVTFSNTTAVVHRRPGGGSKWNPIAEFCYPARYGMPSCGKLLGYYANSSLSPADLFPHLIPSFRSIISVTDEMKYIVSDWHPDSILASICTERAGPKVAMKKYVNGLFKWLSEWMDPNAVTWDTNSSVASAPLASIYDGTEDDTSSTENNSSVPESATSLMASLTAPSRTKKSVEGKGKDLLEKLQTALSSRLNWNNDVTREKELTKLKHSKEYLLSLSSNVINKDEDTESQTLPFPLECLNRDELCFLWALGELIRNPPKLQDLDVYSQLTLFCISLMRHVEVSKYDSPSDSNSCQSDIFSTPYQTPLFSVKQKLKISKKPIKPMTIASGTALSALLGDSQMRLLVSCRKPNELMDWITARRMLLPFWLREDEELKKISEEIGQSTYKSTRNVMESALFFCVTGNMTTLKGIAATDRSETGKKFLTFITVNDFSSPHGRKAAEKNAYSLLSKRQYMASAAFFLLARPPMLKTALEIIVTQLDDIALAFFVARIAERNILSCPTSQGQGNLTIGSNFSLKGMGGGGGFAYATDNMSTVDKNTYADWNPELKGFSRDLLESRGFDLAVKDPCLQAIQLLWLRRPNDAAMCLIDRTFSNGKDYITRIVQERIPLCFASENDVSDSEQCLSATTRVMSKINSLVDVMIRPLLMERMDIPNYVQRASSLLLSRVLSCRGIELSSITILPEDLDSDSGKDDNNEGNGKCDDVNPRKHKYVAGGGNLTTSTQSSIFDTFDTTPKPKINNTTSQTNAMESSIFDTFDAVPKRKIHKPTSQTNAMESSIFDTFDTTQKSKVNKPTSQTNIMESSIYPKMNNPTSQTNTMESSIFDTFDTAPKPKMEKPMNQTNTSQTKTMESSIFDTFDTAPKSKIKKPTSQANTMESSIFDSYDAVDNSQIRTGFMSMPLSESTTTSPMFEPKVTNTAEKKNIEDSKFEKRSVPPIWLEWQANFITVSVARRLIREITRIITPFLGHGPSTSISLFRRHIHPLVAYGASRILQDSCDGEEVLCNIFGVVDKLCSTFKVAKELIIEQALILLARPSQPKKVVLTVLLHCITARADLAEDVMRDAAYDQIQRCELYTLSNDDLFRNRKTKHHISSQYVRRQASMIAWQLELCLWLNRGGAFPMSALALKETTIAVRIGLAVASWGRCHECLENILKCEPDCKMDFDQGKQLWRSTKVMASICKTANRNDDGGETTSGGWEFLVDCNRDKATDILQKRKPGSFLIRPHPENHGVFTISFRTNLVSATVEDSSTNKGEKQDTQNARTVKRNDVVQHAIIRLSDVGFRCGSFGPFSSLLKLLEAVSLSLPFDLRFSDPPVQGIIKEEGGQPSPNTSFIRKLALHSKTEHYRWNTSTRIVESVVSIFDDNNELELLPTDSVSGGIHGNSEAELQIQFGMFSQLLTLTELRKQFCAIIAAGDKTLNETSSWDECETLDECELLNGEGKSSDSYPDGSLAESFYDIGEEDMEAMSSRTIRPFLNWCRSLEITIVPHILPLVSEITQRPTSYISSPTTTDKALPFGDAMIRRMIQPKSGVEFRTLRVGEGGHTAVVVLFSRNEAISWIESSGTGNKDADAIQRLDMIEKRRVIERINLNDLSVSSKNLAMTNSPIDENNETEIISQEEVRYRFVDPWEVEVLESKDFELRATSLGREHYVPFTIGAVARACEDSQRSLGGLHLLALWSTAKGGICLTKALASAHPPWERDHGGDLPTVNGLVSQSSKYESSLRQHLYRNMLFRRLGLPQRFLAFIQVELLDLKNLTSPGGSSSLTAYALLRLKRTSSNAPLTHKARTLDSACTEQRKISKSSGPNAPASWGSLVRFRFPLPEDVNCDGVSFDSDREALFKGAPCILQMSVYEKKFMNDVALGGADVKLDALSDGEQLEEWVPLRSHKSAITWFARIRLTLRFELMCLQSKDALEKDPSKVQCLSAGLRKIRLLSQIGGMHEDSKGVQKSVSTPDFVGYLGNITS